LNEERDLNFQDAIEIISNTAAQAARTCWPWNTGITLVVFPGGDLRCYDRNKGEYCIDLYLHKNDVLANDWYIV